MNIHHAQSVNYLNSQKWRNVADIISTITHCWECVCSCFRYQYYLQLKMDVIDGKLQCTPEQAVLLASYSVQGKLQNILFIMYVLKTVVRWPSGSVLCREPSCRPQDG